MSQFTDGKWKKTILACNYAVGNVQDQPVYKQGGKASACTSNSSNYAGLCAAGDKAIDPNPTS